MFRSRRAVVTTALAITTVSALALTGCTSAGSKTAPSTGAAKGTLTLGMTADIPGWDPAVQPGYQGWASQAIWQNLVRCDAQGNPQPDIAQSFTFSSDNTSATFKIRPGMKFTDGTAVDAAAVKTSLDYGLKAGVSKLTGMVTTVTGDLSLTAKLPAAQPLFKTLMCTPLIASPASVKAGETSKTWASPVGSGPYKLDASATTRGSVYTFTKNKNYWNTKAFPYQKLVLKVLSSTTAGVNALKTGQIDGTLIDSSSYNEVKSSSNLQIFTLKAPNTTRLLITDHLGKKIKALGDLRVRQAMNMVFDRTSMAKNLYGGHAVPAYQIFRPGTTAYIDGLKDPYPYDVAKAKQLMSAAGYADGFTLQIPFIQGANLDKLLPYVKQQLGLINIKVEQVTLSGPNMYSELLGGKYPVPLWQLGNYGQPLQDITDYVLPGGIWNVSHQDDATVDRLWKQIVSGQDVEQAEKQINQYTVDQAWFVPMVFPDNFYAHAARVSIPKSTDFAGLQPMLWDFQ